MPDLILVEAQASKSAFTTPLASTVSIKSNLYKNETKYKK